MYYIYYFIPKEKGKFVLHEVEKLRPYSNQLIAYLDSEKDVRKDKYERKCYLSCIEGEVRYHKLWLTERDDKKALQIYRDYCKKLNDTYARLAARGL